MRLSALLREAATLVGDQWPLAILTWQMAQTVGQGAAIYVNKTLDNEDFLWALVDNVNGTYYVVDLNWGTWRPKSLPEHPSVGRLKEFKAKDLTTLFKNVERWWNLHTSESWWGEATKPISESLSSWSNQ